MATWIMHLRLADKLLQYGFQIELKTFYLGSLAPDFPIPNDPQKKQSHFRDDINNRMQPEDFYEAYLHNQQHNSMTEAFLLGYYAHLLADVEWIGNVWRPFKHQFSDIAKQIEADTQFAYDFKRLQYFGHDILYLHESPDYPAWNIVKTAETVTTGLPFLPDEDYLTWLKSDVTTNYDDSDLLRRAQHHDFPCLSKFDLQTWLDCTTGVLIEMFKGKDVPCPNPRSLWGGYIQPYA
ncbi:MAG: zinc dependent phospholipase C family protein [Chloroflexota bacterium]